MEIRTMLLVISAIGSLAVTIVGDQQRNGNLAAVDEVLDRRQCRPIRIPLCRKIGYNMTSMPNEFNHHDQEEAGLEANQFIPLVEVGCSKLLKFFLCSMYFPICLPDFNQYLKPCREVCEEARDGCQPLMAKYGFKLAFYTPSSCTVPLGSHDYPKWPDQLSCSRLPRQSHQQTDGMCMGPPKEQFSPPSQKDENEIINGGSAIERFQESDNSNPNFATEIPREDFYHRPTNRWSQEACRCSCERPFVSLRGEWAHSLKVGNVSGCAYPCISPYIQNTPSRQTFITWWLGTFGILCAIVSTVTVASFLVDMDRFNYPERPIFIISFCYLMVSIGYLIRLFVGHKAVACDGHMARVGSKHPSTCIIVFLLTYFFGMASSVWWVVLSLTWFLAAGLKWSNEAIAAYSPYFHIFAWCLPSAKTITILALTGVDGDPVAGICYVGNTNINYLRAFVLGPLCAYLVLGICFLAAGFISLFRIHSMIKAQQGASKIEKLTKLMYKIGAFSCLYTVPAMTVIACLFYEQHYRDRWELSATCPCSPNIQPGRAVFQLVLVKYCMSLIVGITTGLWVCHQKTVASWRHFLTGLFCCLCDLACGAGGSIQRRRHHGGYGNGGPAYEPAEAIIIKSHTDISSQSCGGPQHQGGYSNLGVPPRNTRIICAAASSSGGPALIPQQSSGNYQSPAYPMLNHV